MPERLQDSDINKLTSYQSKQNPNLLIDFVGAQYNFKDTFISDPQNSYLIESMLRELKIKNLLLIKQIHGEEILEIDSGNKISNTEDYNFYIKGTADAFFIHDYSEFFIKNPESAFGIRTADCLPIFIIGQKKLAVIHAGWKGIANQLLVKISELFLKFSDKDVEVVIGPSAGANDYEVGGDVVEEIRRGGSEPVIKERINERVVGSKRFLLDMPQTALKKINLFLNVKDSYISPISTIEDMEFHSYRRDKEGSGRNLSVIGNTGSLAC